MSKQLLASKQIRKRLKQARDLEEKIFYNTRKGDWREEVITTHDLSSVMTYLANQILDNQSNSLCVLSLLNSVELTRARPLAPYDKNALQVVQIIFNYLREHSNYKPGQYHILNSLQIAFTRLSLNDLSFLDNPKHPAVLFLNKIIKLSNYFQPDAGELINIFTGVIKLLVDRIANTERVTSELFASTNKELDNYFESLSEKINHNTRLVFHDLEKESRVIQAQEHTDQLIQSKTSDEEIPVFLLDFIQNEISPILKSTIEKHGLQSKPCQQLLTDVDTLIWSITYPRLDNDYEYRFNADVPDAMKRIYALFEENNCFQEYAKSFFFEVEELHTKKLQGERVEHDMMISANIFADETYEKDEFNSWEKPEQEIEHIELQDLKEGQWYYLVQAEQARKCQLLVIDHTTQQLAFVNRSGELILKVKFIEAKSTLGSLSPIYEEENFDYQDAIQSLEQTLENKVKILKNQHDKFLLEKKKIAEKEQLRINLEEARKQEIREQEEKEKRLQQIQQEKMLRLRKERKEEEKRLGKLNSEQRFGLKRIYDHLIPGVQIAYKNDHDKWQSLTLSLISEITQRYIFVDGLGKKVFEPDKKQLNELVDTLRIKIVKPANRITGSFQSPTEEMLKKTI